MQGGRNSSRGLNCREHRSVPSEWEVRPAGVCVHCDSVVHSELLQLLIPDHFSVLCATIVTHFPRVRVISISPRSSRIFSLIPSI
jgi:hypothetical protein